MVYALYRLWRLPAFWNISKEISPINSEILTSLIFIVLLSLERTLLNLPFRLYESFIIEQRFGFNNETLVSLLLNKVKILIYCGLILLPLTCIVLVLAPLLGMFLWIYTWVIIYIETIIVWIVYPYYVMPWFVKCKPIPAGELKIRLTEVCKRVNFPMDRVFVTSDRTNSVYVQYRGLYGSKYLIIADTAIQKLDMDCILALVGHELGRWSNSYFVIRQIMRLLYNGFKLYAYQRLIYESSIYTQFNVPNMFIIGYVILGILYNPMYKLYTYIENTILHRLTYSADIFSKNLGFNIRKALIKRDTFNLQPLSVDSIYSVYFNDTSSVTERLTKLHSRNARLD